MSHGVQHSQGTIVAALRAVLTKVSDLHHRILEWRNGIENASIEDEDAWELEVQMEELADALMQIAVKATLGDSPGDAVSDLLATFHRHKLVGEPVLDGADALESALSCFAYQGESSDLAQCRNNFVKALDEWLALISLAEGTE